MCLPTLALGRAGGADQQRQEDQQTPALCSESDGLHPVL